MTGNNRDEEIEAEIGKLDEIEALSAKIILLLTQLNFINKEEARGFFKKIEEEIEVQESMLKNAMDIETGKLGSQAERNYEQFEEMTEGEAAPDAYMWQVKEALNDVGIIIKNQEDLNITAKQANILEKLEDDLELIREIYNEERKKIPVETLEKHLNPEKIKSDIEKKDIGALAGDLHYEEELELKSMVEIFKNARNLQSRIYRVLMRIQRDGEELKNILEKAEAADKNTEEVGKFLEITKDAEKRFEDLNTLTEDIGADLQDLIA